jgi:CRISPR-associated protein Cas2
MWVVVCYDVNTETPQGRRRLRRVAQVCKNYGQRVQKSVFECQVDEMKFEDLRRKLLREIDKDDDSLRLYRLVEPRERYVEQYGNTRTFFFDDEALIA